MRAMAFVLALAINSGAMAKDLNSIEIMARDTGTVLKLVERCPRFILDGDQLNAALISYGISNAIEAEGEHYFRMRNHGALLAEKQFYELQFDGATAAQIEAYACRSLLEFGTNGSVWGRIIKER